MRARGWIRTRCIKLLGHLVLFLHAKLEYYLLTSDCSRPRLCGYDLLITIPKPRQASILVNWPTAALGRFETLASTPKSSIRTTALERKLSVNGR